MGKQNQTEERLDREIDCYLQEKKAEEPPFSLYREIVLLQQRYSGRIKSTFTLGPDQSRRLLQEGRHLLSEVSLHIDSALFRTILGEVVEVYVDLFPQGEQLRKLMDQPELTEKRVAQFLSGERLPDRRELEKKLGAWGWNDAAPADCALAAGVVREALAPFYLSFAGAVQEEIDLGLWNEGCCPVCGQKPDMALLNEEGVRFLECFFCSTRWQFPRLECPFCRNKDPQRLGYFHADEYPGRRVQICEHCKSYLKTAVMKEIGREIILGLEDIYTTDLDILARREGYRAGRDLAVLEQ